MNAKPIFREIVLAIVLAAIYIFIQFSVSPESQAIASTLGITFILIMTFRISQTIKDSKQIDDMVKKNREEGSM